MTPGDLYRTCKVSAHRLETLQHYTVPSDHARQRTFHASGTLPTPDAGKQADLDLLTELRRNGRHIERVHIVAWPLTDYLRYELAAYRENADAGETILIADAASHPGLEDLAHDFAIFDPETDEPHVILFDYDQDGLVHGYEHTQDPAIVARCWDIYRLARQHSAPLAAFTAAHGLAR